MLTDPVWPVAVGDAPAALAPGCAVAVVIFGLITCAWTVPTVASVGGLAAYRRVVGHLSRVVIHPAPIAGNMRMLGVFGWYLISSTAGLLLLDPRLQKYLPPGTPRKKIWDDGVVQVYLIELDPTAPLRLGAEGWLVLTAVPGGAQ